MCIVAKCASLHVQNTTSYRQKSQKDGQTEGVVRVMEVKKAFKINLTRNLLGKMKILKNVLFN